MVLSVLPIGLVELTGNLENFGEAEAWYFLFMGQCVAFFSGVILNRQSTERYKARLELELANLTDPLTGLSNRRHLFRFAKARGGRAFTLVLIDIDHFKAINDRYGHHIGDQVLCRVADIISQALGGEATAFRVGGEEFLVIDNAEGADGKPLLAERIRTQVETAAILAGQGVTVSIGQTVKTTGETLDEALRRVDAKLYQSKDAGRNRVTLG